MGDEHATENAHNTTQVSTLIAAFIGNSSSAKYVVGWRIDLDVERGLQLRLARF
jgi:hypothetical protein